MDTAPTLKFDKSTFSDDALPVGTTPLGVVSSFEAAASLPLGISTVGLSFANSFKIDVNADNKNSFILVWGGATATGIIAIQVAKLMYGLKVITTASPRNREFLTGLGADFVIDYNDKDAVDQIRSIGSSSIRWALDTVGTLETYQAVYDATSLSEDITIDELLFHEPSVLKQDPSRKSVKFITTVGYFVFGEPINVYVKSTTYPPAGLASDFEEFKKNLLPILPKIKTARLRTLKSGLESFNEAYSLLKEEKVSGEKVVWRI